MFVNYSLLVVILILSAPDPRGRHPRDSVLTVDGPGAELPHLHRDAGGGGGAHVRLQSRAVPRPGAVPRRLLRRLPQHVGRQ